jgi:hypothetical protein
VSVLIGLLIVLALFAVAVVGRLGLGVRQLSWSWTWKSWAALGVAAGLLMAGRWGGALVFGALGLGLARPRIVSIRDQPEAEEAMAARAMLGVRREASPSEIRAAYRSKMAAAHPDAGGASADAQALTRARDLLLRGGRF